MQALKPFTPTMVGGSADLVESTKTEFDGGGLFSATHARPQHRLRHPRARDGLDRERDRAARRDAQAVRLDVPRSSPTTCGRRCGSRRSGTPGRLGLDARLDRRSARTGPTHQPVEHLMSLRAIPNLWFVRPATRTRPRSRGRSRSSGRTARWRSRSRARSCRRSTGARSRPRGARARRLRPLGERRAPDVILIASGSEVALALEAARTARGSERHRGARRLDALLGALRGAAAELPRRGAAARGEGAPLGRGRRLVRLGAVGRLRGRLVAVDRFGASAPAGTVLEQLGFTVENVVARAAALLERVA